MSLGNFLSVLFEKLPEWPIKNDLRYFLAFSSLIPSFIKDMSPVRGYEKYYNLKEGDIVVDAGAYPGDYAAFAARKVGKKGKVIAFEPDKKNRKILQRNLEKEGLNNFIVIEKGLWDKKTKLKFSGQDGLHSTLFKEVNQSEVEVVKLDEELKKIGIKKIDVLKMDIEGAEIKAIQGAEETLKNNNVKVMIASYHIVNGATTSHFLEKYLSDLCYQVKTDYPKHLTTYAWKSEAPYGKTIGHLRKTNSAS